ncbi:MAG: hypothetical protein SP1CHLAM54_16890 [Chlamydiia bacterium]|nr:hypothetical protein [Chlamydiia bacterium]MCH9616577.1 hypothetical protein [Chlamydiia bacterium]
MTRRLWLAALFLTPIWPLINQVFVLKQTSFLLAGVVIHGLVILLFYTFSYEKGGTKLLTFTIWTTTFSLLVMLISIIAMAVTYKLGYSYQLLYYGGLLLNSLFWLYTCRRLRTYNIAREYTRVSGMEEWKALFESMDGLEDLEMLDKAYREAVRKHPKIERALTQHFEKLGGKLCIDS